MQFAAAVPFVRAGSLFLVAILSDHLNWTNEVLIELCQFRGRDPVPLVL
jgi:hypothetical protein